MIKPDFIKKTLFKRGFQLRRIKIGDYRKSKLSPLEILYAQQNDRFLLSIPVEKCRTQLWHTLKAVDNPFVRTLLEYESAQKREYKSSALEKYYSSFQPINAEEFLKMNSNKILKDTPTNGYFLPWSKATPEDTLEKREKIAIQENRAASKKLTLEAGHTDFGPVNLEKGQVEYSRLVNVFESIKSQGYKEKIYSDDIITGYFLKNDEDWCFIITGGKHRAYALSALNYQAIPIIINSNIETVVDTHHSNLWRHVKSGAFSNKEATELVDKIMAVESPSII